jgi:hypothetical protein
MLVDDGELMLLVAGRLEAAGLDQRKLPAALLPATGLAEARFVRGPDPDLPLPAPPADAADLVARLWAGTEVDLPHEQHRRRRAAQRAAPAAQRRPRPASRSGDTAHCPVPGAGGRRQRTTPRRRRTGACLGARPAEDSPLVAVVDVLLVAAGRGLDPDTVLRHLYGVPAFTRPVPGGDRRFTSDPGGALVEVALELGYRQVDTRDSKILRMDADGAAMLQAQTAALGPSSAAHPPRTSRSSSTPTPTPPNHCRRRGWRPPPPPCCTPPGSATPRSTPTSTPAACYPAPTAASTPAPTPTNGTPPSTATGPPTPGTLSTTRPDSASCARCWP